MSDTDAAPAGDYAELYVANHLTIAPTLTKTVIDWGATVLVARVKFHIEKYFEIFVGSRSLLTSCLAYQIMLEPKYAHLVEQYYVQSIEQFRREIADLKRVEREKTIYSGLVLCSISVRPHQP